MGCSLKEISAGFSLRLSFLNKKVTLISTSVFFSSFILDLFSFSHLSAFDIVHAVPGGQNKLC